MSEKSGEKAMDLALRYLSYKARTDYEMTTYLSGKEVAPPVIEQVMRKLKAYRYIDDACYLQNYVENNRNLNRFGSRRMMQDLRRRGMGEDLLLTLSDRFSKEEEKQACLEVANKTLKMLTNQTWVKKKKKLYDKLLRMGYPPEMVLDCVKSFHLEEADMVLSADEMEQERNKLRAHLDRDYDKYKKRYEKKGIEGRERDHHLKRSLMGRGYAYEDILEKMASMKEE